jgi:hypothetical protein
MAETLEIRTGEPVEVTCGSLCFSIRRREVGEDGGVTIALLGPVEGQAVELLRFDLFRLAPHYHVPSSNPAQIEIDPRAGEPLEFALSCIRDRLAELLREAGHPELARSVEGSALGAVAERLREAVRAAPEPSSVQRIELGP